jgi:hypothetical protein
MKLIRLFLLVFLSTLFFQTRAQFMEPKINPDDPALPAWVKLMYAGNPNVYLVDSAYQAYYRQVPFAENSYTRYLYALENFRRKGY